MMREGVKQQLIAMRHLPVQPFQMPTQVVGPRPWEGCGVTSSYEVGDRRGRGFVTAEQHFRALLSPPQGTNRAAVLRAEGVLVGDRHAGTSSGMGRVVIVNAGWSCPSTMSLLATW